MASSGRFTSLLLLGAVFHGANAVKPLMRPNPQTIKRVASDGTTTNTLDKDALLGGPVIVSADGTLTQTAPSSGSSLLQKVVEMAHSGEAVPTDKVTLIKGLIDDTLIPSLTASRTAAEQALTSSLADIAGCNSAKETTQTNIQTTTEAAVTADRTSHSVCRVTEKGQYDAHLGTDHSCAKLSTFLGTLTNAPTLPTTPNEITSWVQGMTENNRCKGSVVSGYNTDCDAAKATLTTLGAGCSTKQATFESSFCSWNVLLTDMCSTHSSCYTSKNTAFDTLVTDTAELVAKFKVEYKALQKIKCFLDVWLSGTTITTGSYDHCESLDADATSMDITPGSPAAKAACGPSPALAVPGTAGFRTAEYAAQAWYTLVDDTIPCSGSSSGSLIEVLGVLPTEHEEERRGDLGKMKLVQLMAEARSHLNDSDFSDALTGLQDDQVKPKLIEIILAKEKTKE